MTEVSSKIRAAREAMARAEAATGQRGSGPEPAPLTEEQTERLQDIRLFQRLALMVRPGQRFRDAVHLGIWALAAWRAVVCREITEGERERFGRVVTEMWSALEYGEETGRRELLGDCQFLFEAAQRALREFQRRRSA